MEELNAEIDKLTEVTHTLNIKLSEIIENIEICSKCDLTNKTINHKTYNKGKVLHQNGDIIEIEFDNGVIKKFNISLSLKNGFITCEDKKTTETFNKIIKLNNQKKDIEKQIVITKNKIQELENEKKNILKNTDYQYEENENIVIIFNDDEAEDVTNWYKIECPAKNKNAIKKVLKYNDLYKLFFCEGYTAFGQTIRYARNKAEALWYSRIATEEKEHHKTYYDYIEEFKRNNIKFDGKHIPLFIDIYE